MTIVLIHVSSSSVTSPRLSRVSRGPSPAGLKIEVKISRSRLPSRRAGPNDSDDASGLGRPARRGAVTIVTDSDIMTFPVQLRHGTRRPTARPAGETMTPIGQPWQSDPP